MSATNAREIDAFEFVPGRILAGKYEILRLLGRGWESEVYLIQELNTGIKRTAKFFFPRRNPKGRTVKFHATKLHKLSRLDILIQYHTQETVRFRGEKITFLVSDFVEGELLSRFLARQPGKRLASFPAMHLLYALVCGLDSIHKQREYHGDLHIDNIIVQRFGLVFDLKLLDLFNWGSPTRANLQHDVVESIRIFHELLGGRKHYAGQPQEVKAICCGMRPSLILRKYKTAEQLKTHLENLRWS